MKVNYDKEDHDCLKVKFDKLDKHCSMVFWDKDHTTLRDMCFSLQKEVETLKLSNGTLESQNQKLVLQLKTSEDN